MSTFPILNIPFPFFFISILQRLFYYRRSIGLWQVSSKPSLLLTIGYDMAHGKSPCAPYSLPHFQFPFPDLFSTDCQRVWLITSLPDSCGSYSLAHFQFSIPCFSFQFPHRSTADCWWFLFMTSMLVAVVPIPCPASNFPFSVSHFHPCLSISIATPLFYWLLVGIAHVKKWLLDLCLFALPCPKIKKNFYTSELFYMFLQYC